MVLAAVREFANKSAASAAFLDYVKFQAVIKLAASAASQIQGTQVQGSAPIRRPSPDPSYVRPPRRPTVPRRPALPWTWVPWMWEAALAADLITA